MVRVVERDPHRLDARAVGQLEQVAAEAVLRVDARHLDEVPRRGEAFDPVQHLAPHVARVAQRAIPANHGPHDAAGVLQGDAGAARERAAVLPGEVEHGAHIA